jgi:predicted methyltransferase
MNGAGAGIASAISRSEIREGLVRGLALTIAATLSLSIPAGAMAASADIAAAVTSSGRSADNAKLDASRKPAEVLEFFGLKPGMQVIDLFGANRYWAEIMAPAVGPKGSVTVWAPTQFLNEQRKSEFAAFAAKQSNVSLVSSPMEAPTLGQNKYDFLILNLDYHDVYWESAKNGITRMDPDTWLKTVYAAMKPGAVLGVIDHAASAGGDTRAVVEKLHRIDPAVVKADFERAGFVLEGASDLLKNAEDDHSLLVFDPKIRGKTDRFVFKFRKPA